MIKMKQNKLINKYKLYNTPITFSKETSSTTFQLYILCTVLESELIHFAGCQVKSAQRVGNVA